MTCFPSTTTFVLVLGADSPCSDERRAGNLGLTASRLFTCFNATHVSIRTSDTSSSPLEPPSQAYRTLPYHVNASLNSLMLATTAQPASPNLTKRVGVVRTVMLCSNEQGSIVREYLFERARIDRSRVLSSNERVQVKRLHPQLRLSA